MTDFSDLPHEVRHSMFVARICDRWKQMPSTVNDEPQDMLTVLEHELLVTEALKRHA